MEQVGYDERLLACIVTDRGLGAAYLKRTLWTTLPEDRLQELAAAMVQAVRNDAAREP
jgi:hypothetical protein